MDENQSGEDKKITWEVVRELHNGNKVVYGLGENRGCGMINQENEIICELKYRAISDFNEDVAILKLDNLHYGYIDIYGDIICDCIYKYAGIFKNGLAEVSKENRSYPSNFINRFGIEILPAPIRKVSRNDKYIKATKYIKDEGSYDILLDLNLNIIFNTDKEFSDIREIGNDLFIVNKQWGDHLVDLDGKFITKEYPPKHMFSRKFELIDNYISCLNTASYTFETFFNLLGDEFVELHDIHDNRRLVKSKDNQYYYKYGYLDETGKIVIPCTFDYADRFIDGKALVQRENEYFFVDINGDKVKEIFQYRSINKFYNSVAIVEKDNFYGIINAEGNEIISCKFKSIYKLDDIRKPYGFNIEINDVYMTVVINVIDKKPKYGLINHLGIEILPPIYDRISNSINELTVISLDDKYGFIDVLGNIVIPIIYDEVEDFSLRAEKTVVCIDDKRMEIDKKGKIIRELDSHGNNGDSYYESQSELDKMYRDAFDGFPDAEWNVD